jgi:hypothetical protein
MAAACEEDEKVGDSKVGDSLGNPFPQSLLALFDQPVSL